MKSNYHIQIPLSIKQDRQMKVYLRKKGSLDRLLIHVSFPADYLGQVSRLELSTGDVYMVAFQEGDVFVNQKSHRMEWIKQWFYRSLIRKCIFKVINHFTK